jgi:hypothetical protein
MGGEWDAVAGVEIEGRGTASLIGILSTQANCLKGWA